MPRLHATDPDVTSIQLALSGMRGALDHRGKKQRIPPKKAIFPAALEFIGAELLGGDDRFDAANRTINAFKRRSGMPSFDSWQVWDYLTDPARRVVPRIRSGRHGVALVLA